MKTRRIQVDVGEPEPGKEAVGKVEASRGDLFYYVKSGEENPRIPNTVRIRTPKLQKQCRFAEKTKYS